MVFHLMSRIRKLLNMKKCLLLIAIIIPAGCRSEAQVQEKYIKCESYRVVSERELPLIKCDENRLIGKLQTLLGVPSTGRFDVGTAIAVEGFQLDQGLAVSGQIDIETINRISIVSENGLMGEACLFNISQPLRPWKKCDYSNEIIPFQRYLGIEADGFIGPGTVNAVEQFQFNNGLAVSGEIDDLTWSTFLALSNG